MVFLMQLLTGRPRKFRITQMSRPPKKIETDGYGVQTVGDWTIPLFCECLVFRSQR